MTDYSITISNRLKVKYATVDDSPSQWGTLVWGTNFWWGDFDTTFDIEKWIADSVTVSQSMFESTDKWLSEGIGLSDAFEFGVERTISNSFSMSVAIAVAITEGDWTRDEPDLATWTQVDDGSGTWTPTSSSSTNWSDS